MQPVIIAVGYNRPDSMKRLLSSIKRANFQGEQNVTLIVSIDFSGSDEVYRVAQDFVWGYGEKKIIKHGQNIGLRKHILSCGDLTKEYGSVIIFEDDMYVSPDFYVFAKQALEKYCFDERIAGVSLYSYSFNEFAQAPFVPLSDGFDAYFMQMPSSQGQMWTTAQWQKFRDYYDAKGELKADYTIPPKIYNWPASSWKKYFYKYIADNNLYFVFPKVSLATNFGDVGTHFAENVQFFQVPLCYPHNNQIKYNLPSFNESINKYDAYWEPLPEMLKAFGVDFPFDFEVDLYGLKKLEASDKTYFLSLKPCSKADKTYGLRLFPILLNIVEGIEGTEISLGTKKSFENQTIVFSGLINRQLHTSGYLAGHSAGQQSIFKSTSYKLGYYLLHPFKLLKRK